MPPHLTIWLIAALSTTGVILRPFKLPEAIWALAGAGLLVALRLISPQDALTGAAKGTDVYLFLTGMMLLAEVARAEGLFDWLAALATQQARGSGTRLFLLIYAVGAAVTIFLSNDATAVVLTPAVAAAVKTAKAKEPLPYLLICAFVANAASFVLPISNPANLVIYGHQMPPLLNWLPRYLPASALAIAATYMALRWTQRGALAQRLADDVTTPALSATGKVAALGIVATAGVLLTASALDVQLGLPTAIAGAVTAAVVLVAARKGPVSLVKDISWGVLPLVAGLFILVEALDKTGLIAMLATLLHDAAQGTATSTAWGAGVFVALASNLINNLPMGLIAGGALQSVHGPEQVTSAVLIGVDLGPNLSVTGSLATILWLTALRREGLQVGAGAFLKLGLLIMPPALLLALGALSLSDPTLLEKISMQNMSATLLYPFILIAGALQAWGPPMNGVLRTSLTNPWLASLVSFLPIVAVLACLLLCLPRPFPTLEGLSTMPWWAPLGGLVGAFAVVAGLMFVNKVGAGAFAGLTITANILMSLAIDRFGWFGMEVHPLNPWRIVGAALMVSGIALIARF